MINSLLALFAKLFSDKIPDEASHAAQSWLKLIDDNDAVQSWVEASSLFKGAVTQNQWESVLPGRRGPLGQVVLREVASTKLAKSRLGAPDGQYVRIRYETEFGHKKKAVEFLELQLDHDKKWRVCGYFFK